MSLNKTLGQDARTMTLIGLAHGTSHFFHFLLPPLFAAFIQEFGGDYEKLAYLVTVFFLVSALGQAASGFLVDRFGARPLLFVALGCLALSAICAALASGFGLLIVSSVLAGLGNAPFHPVDFTILNKRVSSHRLGHAYSVHGVSGALGWAFASAFVTMMMHSTGSWRMALAGAAILALMVMLILLRWRADLDDRVVGEGSEEKAGVAVTASNLSGLGFLKLPVVWMCFLFFFWFTSALAGIQGFSAQALVALQERDIPWVGFAVTGFFLCSAIGMILGGFWVQHQARLERLIGVCLLVSAGLLLAVGSGVFSALPAMALLVLSGFGVGLVGPSRDMLIKRAAPYGATGRVYGTVYSGLDLGIAIASPVFGRLLDHSAPEWVFYGAAGALVLAMLAATWVGAQIHSVHPASASAG